MGDPARHRAPTFYRIERELIGWLCILAPTFGLLAATANDAARSGDTIWATLFWGLTLATLGLYFYVVRVWVTLVS